MAGAQHRRTRAQRAQKDNQASGSPRTNKTDLLLTQYRSHSFVFEEQTLQEDQP
jgi:hypothetical protein